MKYNKLPEQQALRENLRKRKTQTNLRASAVHSPTLVVQPSSMINGEISVSGAKNAALPCIAASLLTKQDIVLSNVPQISDTNNIVSLIKSLGIQANFIDNHTLKINSLDIQSTKIESSYMSVMRASILIMAPVLSRCGQVIISAPGGCKIGSRPIDFHLKAMESLGALIEYSEEQITLSTPNGLIGAEIHFPRISVGATLSAMYGAVLAKGITKIYNYACEPENINVINMLNAMGADIRIYDNYLEIHGVKELKSANINIIPDRIEALSYALLCSAVSGRITLNNASPKHCTYVLNTMQQMGIDIETPNDSTIIVSRPSSTKLKNIDITTSEYPGFPTDIQAQWAILASQAQGVSNITETIFETRFLYVSALNSLGVKTSINNNTLSITREHANERFNITQPIVQATDLRSGFAMVMAATLCNKELNIQNTHHLFRGYEDIENKLEKLNVNAHLK